MSVALVTGPRTAGGAVGRGEPARRTGGQAARRDRSTRRTARSRRTDRRGPSRRDGRRRRDRRSRQQRLRLTGGPTGEHDVVHGGHARRCRRDARPPRGVRVVGDGLRRIVEQRGAADRGSSTAPRRRVRVRPPARVGRGAGRAVAAGASRSIDHRAPSGHRRGERRQLAARHGVRVGPRPPARARTTRRHSSCISTISPRRSRPRSNVGSTVCSTSRRTAGCRANGYVRCQANVHASRCPTGRRSGSAACAGGSNAVRSRPGCGRTRSSRGSSPTACCAAAGGRRRSRTSRPTSRAPSRSGGR